MQTKSKILEDVAKLGLGGLGLVKGVKAEIKRGIRSKIAGDNNDAVSSQEFRVFAKIVQENKLKIIELETRITQLELQLSSL